MDKSLIYHSMAHVPKLACPASKIPKIAFGLIEEALRQIVYRAVLVKGQSDHSRFGLSAEKIDRSLIGPNEPVAHRDADPVHNVVGVCFNNYLDPPAGHL